MLLMCTYNLETYVLNVNPNDKLDTIKDRIRSRWSCLPPGCMMLYYKVPNYSRCMLRNDEDIRIMFSVVESFKVDFVNVDLIREDTTASGSSKNSFTVDEVMLPDEDNIEHEITAANSRNERIAVSLGWDKLVLEVAGCFKGGAVEFRLVLQKISLHSGFQYVYTKNDKHRVTAVCAMKTLTGCGWFVHASKESANGFFYVRRLCDIHSCGSVGRSFEGARLSANLVCAVIHDLIRDKPTMTPSEVKLYLFSQFGLKSSYDIARAAVDKAKDSIFGDAKQSFKQLPAYVKGVRESNPGSTIVLDVDPVTNRFRRLFVAFNGCVEGFSSCRPLIFLDGAHLKSQCRGHLLAATGKDGNQGIYPLCFAVVDSENFENWEWFLSHMKAILPPDRRLTFITDRNVGLVDAISVVYKEAFHAFCLYHLKLNLREKCHSKRGSKFHRDRMVSLLTECAYATSVEVFNQKMNDMRLEGGDAIKEFFKNLKPENWANAFFKGNRFGHMCSSAAESFNSWVLKERCYPVATMVDAIRAKIMKLHSERRSQCQSWPPFVCPNIDAKLCEAMDHCRNWHVVSSTRFKFEVYSSPRAIVDLKSFTCSCTAWQRLGYPCPHAVAAIMKIQYPVYHFVDGYYMTTQYADSYKHPIYPIPAPPQLNATGDSLLVLPPQPKRQPGRPRKKRIPSRGESTRKMKCGRCGINSHHNKTTCGNAAEF